MKILISSAQFSSHFSGLQRHAFNMVRCLLTQPDISSIHLALAPWQRELAQAVGLHTTSRVTLHIADMASSAVSRNLWHYRRLPQLAAEIRPDIVHLSYPVPVDASAIPCPVVLTLHDLYPYEIPENFGFPKVLFNRLILRQCLHAADAITCVSGTTALRMKQYLPQTTRKKSHLIYNCVEPEPACAEYSPLPDWHGEPFLLTVSQHRKNKNIHLLIRAFHRLLRGGLISSRMKLVVVGITGPETQYLHQLTSELQLNSSLIFLQGLSEPALQWCYRHCESLAAPSETEGFGLPVAEALLTGCRVVCSDIPAFREIDAEHCRFVTLGPGAEERFAQAILASLHEPPPLPISLPRFSSQTLGAQYIELYRELLSTTAHRRTASMQSPAPEAQLSLRIEKGRA